MNNRIVLMLAAGALVLAACQDTATSRQEADEAAAAAERARASAAEAVDHTGTAISESADAAAARTLEEQAANLSELQRPVVLNLPFEELTPGVLGDIRFDVALGRDVLSRASDVQGFFSTLLSVMAPEGEAVLAEPHSRRAQRLYRLLDLGDRPDVRERLAERLEAAEEAIYEGLEGRFGPAPDEVREAALAAGFAAAQLVTREISAVRRISHGAVEGWFRTGGPQPSYAELLGDAFSEEELAELRSLYLSQLAGSERPWTTVVYLLRLSAA